MSEHVRVIEEAINHLYRRIGGASGGDKLRRRVALKALKVLASEAGHQPEKPQLDITLMSVSLVQSAVEGGKITAQEALAQERDGRTRKTLITWLEERIG